MINQDGSFKPPSPAGTVVALYGTGFGVLGQPASDGLRRTVDPVTAYLGDRAVTVDYAGEAPGFTYGLQQINIDIPSDAPTGAQVPLRLSVAGVVTQPEITLAIR